MEDNAAAAWGDDASPGHSPKLEERDIWASVPERPSFEERDTAALGGVGETELDVSEGEEVDVWAIPSQDIAGPSETPELKDTRTEQTATTPTDTTTALSLPVPTSGASSTEEETVTIPAAIHVHSEDPPTQEAEESFDDFDDEPFPAAPAASSSTFPLPASTSGAFPNNSKSNDNEQEEETDGSANPSAPTDDFADFGDFEDFDDVEPAAAFPSSGYQDTTASDGFGTAESGVAASGFGGEFTDEPLHVWDDPDRPAPLKSLSLEPFPPPDLTDQIATLLSRIFPNRDDPTLGENLTREGIRQVEGVNQVLITEASRDLYTQLITPPPLKPLDWKRSRTRREQLISLGIPVNLDEVDTSRLPPLKITTKEGQAAALAASKGRPERQRTRDERMLGDIPPFDKERAERLLSYREDQLSLVPPAYLTRMQQDLVTTLSSASAIVAHLKQTNDILTEDNKAKNEQIAGLIAQAQRMKAAESASGAGGGAGGVFRKASARHRTSNSLSLSGGNTPRRVNSPGMMR